MTEQSPKQEEIKKLQEEMTCPLCLGDFDDPKRLPCGHIYCKIPCLQGLLLRSMDSTVTCPECRSVAQVPANDLDKLPKAFQIKEVDSDSITVPASPQGISNSCPNHTSQSQDLYCETCQELMCRDCIVVPHQHQKHRYSLVKDVAAEQKEVVLKELVLVKTFTEQATDSITKIEEVRREVVSQKENLTKEITASFDALHRVLEEEKQALLVDLQKKTDLKLATIKTQQQDIEAASGKLQQVIESVYTAATQDDDCQFLSKKTRMAGKITEAVDEVFQVDLNPAIKSDLVARVMLPGELKQAFYSTNYVQKGVSDPQRCSAKGDGLIGAEINILTTFTVNIANEHGIPCSGKVSVELKTLRDGTITKPRVTACSPSQYKVSYTPTVRGRHELSIKVNGEHITDSPFKVFVQIPISKIKEPVAEIKDLAGTGGLHSTAERILVCDIKGDQIAVYNHGFQRVITIGEGSHFTAKKLKGPAEVTADSQLNVYVTTVEDNSLHKYKRDGTHVKTVNGTGHRGERFSCPNGMCVYENRFLYVCDSKNSRVLVFDLDLKYLSEVSGHFVWPSGLDIDSSGKLYICDSKGSCIKVLAPNGQLIHTISHRLSRPANIKIFGEVLYVSDANKNCVLAFTLSGEYIGSFGQKYIKFPEGLAIDEDGFFYVSNNQCRRRSILVF